jgi:hypothetical protein
MNNNSNAKELHFGSVLNLVPPALNTDCWFLTVDNLFSFPLNGSQGLSREEVVALLTTSVHLVGITERFANESMKDLAMNGEQRPIFDAYYGLMKKVAERIQILKLHFGLNDEK